MNTRALLLGATVVVALLLLAPAEVAMATPNLLRARSAIGRGIGYRLGRGGYNPKAALPGKPGKPGSDPVGTPKPEQVGLDCSGYIAWWLGWSRAKTIVPGMWGISTDSIHRDATGPGKYFQRIAAPVPGCIAVFPDKGGKEGHTAIVVDPASKIVIDCSWSQNGVAEHPAAYFWSNPATVWCVPKVAA